MKTPRENFQLSPDRVQKHLETVSEGAVQLGLATAFLELCWNLQCPNDLGGVVANARRQGAKDLIEIFNHLADKRVAPQRPLTTLEPNDA